jgi:hypothetical protein
MVNISKNKQAQAFGCLVASVFELQKGDVGFGDRTLS